jgi:hypothetical protein
MIRTQFEKAKYFYVIYPGACGGNHVCNMLSLCDGFIPRVEQDNYKLWLIEKYKQVPYKLTPPKFVNAHIDNNIHHVDRLYEYVPKEVVSNPEKKLIIQGHLFNFFNAHNSGLLKELGDEYVAIIMDYPPEDSIPYHRITTYGYHSHIREYELPLHIGLLHDENAFKIDDTNGAFFETTKLFTSEGSEYLRQMLHEKFRIELPPEADELHNMWFKWMNHVLDPKTIEFWKDKDI